MAARLPKETMISRWRQTRLLAVSSILSAAALAAIFLLSGDTLNPWRLFGMPLGLFGMVVLLPSVSAILIFWAAIRQRRIDESYGLFRD